MTFTTVGLPFFNASVKKMVPTAEPAKPEKSRYPQVRARILGISFKRKIRIGRNMIRMSTCSQKTITLASNSALSGMRHALSVPQSAAPRPTSHGPYVALVEVRFSIPKRVPPATCRVNVACDLNRQVGCQLAPQPSWLGNASFWAVGVSRRALECSACRRTGSPDSGRRSVATLSLPSCSYSGRAL